MFHALDKFGAITFDRRIGRAPRELTDVSELRLGLSSATPFPTSDITAATSVYLSTCGRGNVLKLYDTTVKDWIPRRLTAEISVAVSSTRFRLADLYAYWTGSAIALEATNWNQTTGSITGATNATPIVITSNAHGLSNGDLVGIQDVGGNTAPNGKIWTVQSVAANTFALLASTGSGAYTAGGTWYKIPNTRATALTTQDGRYVKTGTTSRLYLGTIMTTGVTGQCEDSTARRFLWNAYNRRLRKLKVTDSTDTWTYSATAFQVSNAAAANKVEAVCGLVEDPIWLRAKSVANGDAVGQNATAGIGLNSATNVADLFGSNSPSDHAIQMWAEYLGCPSAAGYSGWYWLESGNGSGTQTWYGDAGLPDQFASGMVGALWG